MKIKKWHTIATKQVLNHPRLSMQEDTVILPDGTELKYLRDAPGRPQSVAILAINDHDELLLQREYSYPPDTILWQLPGGGVGLNGDLIVAANRELSEESGLVAASSEVLGYFYTNNRRSDQKQYVVLCQGLTKRKLSADTGEFIETYWKPWSAVQEMIAKGEVNNINMLAALQLLSVKKHK